MIPPPDSTGTPVARSLWLEAEAKAARAERTLERVLRHLDELQQHQPAVDTSSLELTVQRLIRAEWSRG